MLRLACESPPRKSTHCPEESIYAVQPSVTLRYLSRCKLRRDRSPTYGSDCLRHFPFPLQLLGEPLRLDCSRMVMHSCPPGTTRLCDSTLHARCAPQAPVGTSVLSHPTRAVKIPVQTDAGLPPMVRPFGRATY